MSERPAHWPRLLEALRQDSTLQGQWSSSVTVTGWEIRVSSPFHETWIRLRHGALVAALEAEGKLAIRQRRPRRRPGRDPLLGNWNRMAADTLKSLSTGEGDSCLILARAGAGKSFLARSILGSELRIWSVRRLSRVVAGLKRDGCLGELSRDLYSRPLLVLDNVQHLYELPSLSRWLPAILDGRGGRPVLALGRPGPSWDRVDIAIRSRLAGGVTLNIDYPDSETRRTLARAFALEQRVRLPREALTALTQRPLTPGRLAHVIDCLRRVPVDPRQLAQLLRELLRYGHADDLNLLFDHICHHHGIAGDDLRSRRRPVHLQTARGEYASLALQAGWRPAEVALMLDRSPRSVQDLARRHST